METENEGLVAYGILIHRLVNDEIQMRLGDESEVQEMSSRMDISVTEAREFCQRILDLVFMLKQKASITLKASERDRLLAFRYLVFHYSYRGFTFHPEIERRLVGTVPEKICVSQQHVHDVHGRIYQLAQENAL